MHTIEYNLSFLENSLEELETYLLQPELFWPLSSLTGIHPTFPRLTIGTVQLSFNELDVQEKRMTPAELNRTTQIKTRWKALHTKWRSAIVLKSIDEMGSRLNLWKAYILDLEEDKGRQLNYDQEVRQRVRFTLLLELVNDPALSDKLVEAVQAVDQRASTMTTPADFVWDEALQPLYPQEKYAFLYRKPKPQVK